MNPFVGWLIVGVLFWGAPVMAEPTLTSSPDLVCLAEQPITPLGRRADLEAHLQERYEGMVERGEYFNAGCDQGTPGEAGARLILSGRCGEYRYVLYERGGFALTYLLDVFSGEATTPQVTYRLNIDWKKRGSLEEDYSALLDVLKAGKVFPWQVTAKP